MVDAVVGGGGLIQIPLLLAQFPQTVIPTLFGTTKVSSIAGTGRRALALYAQRAHPLVRGAACHRRRALRCLGRRCAGGLDTAPNHATDGHRADDRRRHLYLQRVLQGTDRWKGALFGFVIGAYDGFFGPAPAAF